MQRLSRTRRGWRLLPLAATLVSLANSASAAGLPDSKGTEFWLSLPPNLNTPTLSLFITGDAATTGTVEMPGIAFSENFSVSAGTVTTVTLPAGARLPQGDGVVDMGIHVTAADEVTIYGLNRRQATTDAFLALPVDVLGTEYLLLTYKANPSLVVVGTVDGTTVEITPTSTVGARAADTLFTVSLDAGQVYRLTDYSWDTNIDLTGTLVTADQPIAVFGSNVCTNVPDTAGACDHTVEQMPPVDAWGQAFVSFPLATRLNGDTFRFLAAEDNTTVSINGSDVATLDRGEFHEQIVDGGAQITADNPILVAQFSNGTSYDGVTSDPFMMLVFPYEQFQKGYTFTTPASGFSGNYVNVVVPNDAIGDVKFDDAAIAADDFTAIGATGWSGAQISLTLGSHTLESLWPFGAFVYGFDQADSYGYPGGGSLASIGSVDSVAFAEATATASVGSTYTGTLAVVDTFGDPVAGVRVDVAISGAHSKTISVTTDDQGIGEFTYTGTASGDDTITATLSSLTDQMVITWTEHSVDLAPASATATVGAAHSVTATVLDDSDAPLDGVEVSFTVSGKHTDTGTATTDANGEAAWSYTGSAAGADTITATYAGVAATSACTWSSPTLTASDDTVEQETGAEASITITVTDADGDPVGGVTVTWTLTGVNGDTQVTSTTNDEGVASIVVSGENAGTETVTAAFGDATATVTLIWNEPEPEPEPESNVDLRIDIVRQPEPTPVGMTMNFVVRVRNLGNVGATDVVLRIPLPPGTRFVGAWLVDDAAQAVLAGEVIDGEIVIPLGDVSPEQADQIEVELEALAAGNVEIRAQVISNEDDAEVEDNAAATDTSVSDAVEEEVIAREVLKFGCGAIGVVPLALMFVSLVAMRRNGRQRWF